MTGGHVDAEKVGAGLGCTITDAGDEFGRLPVGDARIGEPAGAQDWRIGLVGEIVVRAVAHHVVVGGDVGERVAPFGPFGRRERQVGVAHGVDHIDKGHAGNIAAKQAVGRSDDDAAHQQTAGRTAKANELAVRCVFLGHEILRDCDEVGEGVLLLVFSTLREPVPAPLRAAADVGCRPDPAAVDERKLANIEGRFRYRAIGAVAVEEDRRRAIELCIGKAQHGDGHFGAIVRLRGKAFDPVLRRIVARGHFLGLHHDGGACHHVVVNGLRRCGGRLVGVAKGGRVELVAAACAKSESGFGLFDRLLCAGCAIADDDARQGVGAFEADEMVREGLQAFDVATRLVRGEILPRGAGGVGEGGGHDLHVDRAIGIGDNIPAPVEMDGRV